MKKTVFAFCVMFAVAQMCGCIKKTNTTASDSVVANSVKTTQNLKTINRPPVYEGKYEGTYREFGISHRFQVKIPKDWMWVNLPEEEGMRMSRLDGHAGMTITCKPNSQHQTAQQVAQATGQYMNDVKMKPGENGWYTLQGSYDFGKALFSYYADNEILLTTMQTLPTDPVLQEVIRSLKF